MPGFVALSPVRPTHNLSFALLFAPVWVIAFTVDYYYDKLILAPQAMAHPIARVVQGAAGLA